MKKITLAFLSALLLLSLTSCHSLKEPEFRRIANVRFGLGMANPNITLDLFYYNPNHTRLRLKKAKGKVWVNNNYLGDFTIDSLVKVPANAEFRMPVNLKVDVSELKKGSLALLLSKEVTIRIEGKAKVGKGGFYIDYPIRYEGKQDLKSLLR